MEDPRKETRKKLMAFAPVYNGGTHALIGYIGNLNLHGVMVVSEHESEIGRELLLKVELPSSLAEEIKDLLVLPSRVAWCKKDESGLSFMIGFEFIQVTPEQELIIQAILDRYHFKFG